MNPLKVVVLLSGGLDSMLTVAKLVAAPVSEVERVHALIFMYNQSNAKEVSCAAEFCKSWGVPCTIQNLEIAQTDVHNEIPARNLIFIANAAAFAMRMNFNAVALGAEPDSTYTDSTPLFLAEMDSLLRMFGLTLIAPVKKMANKRALVEAALDLGVPLHLVHSSRSNEVDGACKTSAMFLGALRQLFPNFLSPKEILFALATLNTFRDEVRDTVYVQYIPNHSFKFAAALFTVAARPEFLQPLKIEVYSTGSWMRDLAAVMQMPSVRTQCQTQLVFTNTHALVPLMHQMLNCDHKVARWGILQAVSGLKRPRYSKFIACRQTQGNLASALESLGYTVERPNERRGVLLETAVTGQNVS